MNFATWKVLRVFPLQSRCFASPPIGERSKALHWTGSESGGTRCSVDPITVDQILMDAGIDPLEPQASTLASDQPTSEQSSQDAAVEISAAQVNKITSKFGIGELAKTEVSHAEHATDFTPPIYNIWKQQEKTNGSSHFGNSEVRWVEWLSRIDKDAKEARNKRIFDMWMACYTQQEIADAVGVPQKSVDDVTKSFSENGSIANLAKSDQSSAEHATDFTPPIYNIWKQQEKTNGSSHFGNSEVRWVEWLSRIDKDAKEARNKRIFDMWMACYTQQEIADAVGIPKGTVDTLCLEMATSPNSSKLTKTDAAAAEHATDFTPPIYNIWKQQEKTHD